MNKNKYILKNFWHTFLHLLLLDYINKQANKKCNSVMYNCPFYAKFLKDTLSVEDQITI